MNGQNEPSCCGKRPVNEEEIIDAFAREQRKSEWWPLSSSTLPSNFLGFPIFLLQHRESVDPQNPETATNSKSPQR